jgi:hypothetical protein
MRRAARADEDQPLRTRLQGATSSSGRTPKRRAPLTLVVATLLGLLPIGLRADDADRPDLLYRRVFIIGDRDAIQSDPDGRKSVTAYTYDVSVAAAKELVVSDPRLEIPPPCGGKIARHFLDRLLARFNVLAVSDCRLGPSAVHCPSEYLPSYLRDTRKIFLELDYARSAQTVKLELDIFQRRPGGEVAQSTLDEADRNWYNDLYRELQEQVNCE